jgi:hypothetical protein
MEKFETIHQLSDKTHGAIGLGYSFETPEYRGIIPGIAHLRKVVFVDPGNFFLPSDVLGIDSLATSSAVDNLPIEGLDSLLK